MCYNLTSEIPGFPKGKGELIVSNLWSGTPNETNFRMGPNWYSDSPDPNLNDSKLQGGKTILKWRNDILMDWAER